MSGDSLEMGGWDCHAHVFGPYDRYPLAPGRSYTPPEATWGDYRALLPRLGLARGVLVHPSAYGTDLSLLLDTLARDPALRGVAVALNPSLEELRDWRNQGVRALRFSHRSAPGANFAGSASFDDLRRLAPRLAEAQMHAELWTDSRALADISRELLTLPIPVVVDHMGGFDSNAGVGDPGFRALIWLLKRGRIWVKLCAYRNLLEAPSVDRGRPFHRALLNTDATRLVWGSDWPHLRVDPMPSTLSLLDMFNQWTDSDALKQAILVDNPQRLYG